MTAPTRDKVVAHDAIPPPLRILHLIIDDKFLDFVFDVFQEVGNAENRYVAIVGGLAQQTAHIRRVPLWRVVGSDYAESPYVNEDLAWCDVLVVHWWHNAAARVVAKVPDSVIVVWSGWGGDYYNLLPGGEAALYGEKTKALLGRINMAAEEGASHRGRDRLRRLKTTLKNLLSKGESHVVPSERLLIKRFDFFSAPIQDDYDLLRAALGMEFCAEYVQLNYGSVERTFSLGQRPVFSGAGDILLGNSATATNNHVEIIDLLSSMDIANRKVVVPLSYGMKLYGDEIERYGRRLLGDKFIPVRGYMPLDEYNGLISGCSVAIMNHFRQQAVGNIATMLYNGAKVFLNENGVLYEFFKNRGAHIFPVGEIAELGAAAFSLLNAAEMMRNAEVIKELWGHEVVINNARMFIGLMQKRKTRYA